MADTVTKLEGMRFKALIGEPWDFRSSAGDNALTGTIVEANEEGEWALCQVSSFAENDATIDRVALVRRSRSDTPFLELLASGEWVSTNLLYSIDRPLDADWLEECLRSQKGLEFLIGSVQTELRRATE